MSELISKKHKDLITNPLGDSNPVTVQVLGICSALAVTVQMKNALVMSLAVLMVVICSNMLISSMRNVIPGRIRIIVQLVIVAALVIVVDQLLKAFVFDVSKQLSVFVGLIITNCIIMGRLEAFALNNTPSLSAWDGLGNGIGYGLILLVVAFFKELLGAGKLFGFQVIPEAIYQAGYMNNNLMLLPPSSLIVVGIYIWVQRSFNQKLIEKN
jgi:Na+-transporting NADH:ubiquinone oxidoreductase subunit D